MKFLQKRWVAFLLTAVMIAAALAIGQAKDVKDVPQSTLAAEQWGEENYVGYLDYVRDEASLLSESTIRRLCEINGELDHSYGSICGVVTTRSLDGRDIEDAAYDLAYNIGLGETDFILLLDQETSDWYFLSGEDAYHYMDHDLEIVIKSYMDQVFQDPDVMLLAMFEELQTLYQASVPEMYAVPGGERVMVAGGVVLFVTVLVILIALAVVMSVIRTSRRVIGGAGSWWPLLFVNRRTRDFHYHGPASRPGPGPGSGSVPGARGFSGGSRNSSSSSRGFGSSSRSGSGQSRGFGGGGRGNFGRGGGFGGGRRGGGFGGRR